MDDKTFFATVAERAGLSKEEARDLTHATLETIAGQIGSGEVKKLVPTLPDWLLDSVPHHDGSSHPMALTEFVQQLSRRTGLNEEETRRGVRAVLTVLREVIDPTHLEHAMSQLPKDYRQLEAV